MSSMIILLSSVLSIGATIAIVALSSGIAAVAIAISVVALINLHRGDEPQEDETDGVEGEAQNTELTAKNADDEAEQVSEPEAAAQTAETAEAVETEQTVEQLEAEQADEQADTDISACAACDVDDSADENESKDVAFAAYEQSDSSAARRPKSFAEKLAEQNATLVSRYNEVHDELLTYKGVKSRISFGGDTFKYNAQIVAKISINGKTLRLNLPLDCLAEEYNDGTCPHFDSSEHKKYEMVPFTFKVTSSLALKRAKSLIETVMTEQGAVRK